MRTDPQLTIQGDEALDLLPPDVAADILCISTDKLMRMRGQGEGPPFLKIGKRIAYPRKALVEFVGRNLQSGRAA